jgi:uncharacterized membrane protein YhaH (DUF805 family)
MNWYFEVLKKYAVFNGRARRQEFWMFFLFNFIIGLVLAILEAIVPVIRFIGIIYGLGVLIPYLAVGVRRLHDTGRTGWWLLIGLIPIVGEIVLLIFFVLDSQPGDNKYGPNPKKEVTANTTQPIT